METGLRSMVNSFRKLEFYRSTFDPLTGTLVRDIVVPDEPVESWMVADLCSEIFWAEYGNYSHLSLQEQRALEDEITKDFHKKYGETRRYIDSEGQEKSFLRGSGLRKSYSFSPVPETVDVKVTDWCNGPNGQLCAYCYQDSTKRGGHAPPNLLTSLFDGLEQAPYQIAFGGGEPTAHPDFPWFLEYTRSKGTVPNYTTAGHIIRPEVIEATNAYGGGVALTYHPHTGVKWFAETYSKWRKLLNSSVQLNVHVIFDDNVAKTLLDLQDMGLKNLNIVLLAFYSDVGRATNEGIPSRWTYEVAAPKVIEAMTSEGHKFAFSEGLLPYFLSHQFPSVDTTFACRQEGVFSCYVDDKGRVSASSFSPPEEDDPSIYENSFQELWNSLDVGYGSRPSYTPCGECVHRSSCSVPDSLHFMLCKYAEHNQRGEPTPPKRKLKVVDDSH